MVGHCACTHITASTPKSLLRVKGTSLIERSVHWLNNIKIIDLVVGYHHQVRATRQDRARFVLNPFYEQTNNMASFWPAISYLHRDAFIYMHGGVFYDVALLRRLTRGYAGADMRRLVDFDIVDDEAFGNSCSVWLLHRNKQGNPVG